MAQTKLRERNLPTNNVEQQCHIEQFLLVTIQITPDFDYSLNSYTYCNHLNDFFIKGLDLGGSSIQRPRFMNPFGTINTVWFGQFHAALYLYACSQVGQ